MIVVILMRAQIKLDIGAGHRPKNGFLTVDINPVHKPNLIADANHLPFSNNSIDEIYCSHVLEHLTQPLQCVREAWRVLTPGQRATFLVPNINLPWTVYLMWKYGSRQTPYENHKWKINRASLERLLRTQGFIVSKPLPISKSERHWGVEWIFYATPFARLLAPIIYLLLKLKYTNIAVEMINARCYKEAGNAPETKLSALKNEP